jgi:RNA polymerase sigma factor (sigma-70 family)
MAASGEDTGVLQQSDADVIAASAVRPAHFGLLFDRHATVLHRYVVRRLGPDDADAIVGEVFRIAFEKRHTYDLERPNARPWLYGIATNLVAKHRRTEARRLNAVARLAAERLPFADLADRVSSAIDATDRWNRVAAAVNALPDLERDALVLHVWEALSYDEIAGALGVPIGTVRSRMNRARTRLRELDESSGRQHSDKRTQPGRMQS